MVLLEQMLECHPHHIIKVDKIIYTYLQAPIPSDKFDEKSLSQLHKYQEVQSDTFLRTQSDKHALSVRIDMLSTFPISFEDIATLVVVVV